jgi:prepilin-type N-terminal cleavage/methylation domain-containing protein
MIKKLDQNGFTIVELLIATAVFASVLFIVTYGIIQISKMFTNGFIQTQTQNVAVSLSDQLTRDVEFSSASTMGSDQGPVNISGLSYYYFCTYQYEYFYNPGGSLYKIPISAITNCQSPKSSWITNPQTQDLLSSNMEILNNLAGYDDSTQQSIIATGSTGSLYSINLDILYGSTNNLRQNINSTQWVCKPTVIIGPFCATYTLTTGAYAQD